MTELQAPHGKNGSSAPALPIPALDVRVQLEGSRLLVLGGTGFLGKIFWVMMLARFPSVGRIYLLVRKSATKTSEERFWAEVAKIRCPVLIVRGAESDILAPEVAARFGGIVKAEVRTVPGAGHSVMGDNPSGFLAAVEPFLAGLAPA